MKIKIIGSGGCVSIPRPLCQCRICREARIKGVPYARCGCSLYLEDLNLLIDTPEDINAEELFVMKEIVELKDKYQIEKVIITHLEEDWGKSYDDYLRLQKQYEGIEFAYDGMKILLPTS